MAGIEFDSQSDSIRLINDGDAPCAASASRRLHKLQVRSLPEDLPCLTIVPLTSRLTNIQGATFHIASRRDTYISLKEWLWKRVNVSEGTTILEFIAKRFPEAFGGFLAQEKSLRSPIEIDNLRNRRH